jgi:uncharacterized membrane protein YhaH (DUF805 family)
MSFGESVRTCFTKYVEFKGRASRPEYWWFFLSYFIVYFLALGIGYALRAGATLGLLVGLGYFLPLLAAAVRRLHDTGRSGWWYLIGLIPIVGVILLIVYLASEGNPADNQYGPPPGVASPGLPSQAPQPPPPPPPPA